MEALLWTVRTAAGVSISLPIMLSLIMVCVMCWEYFFLLPRAFYRRARFHHEPGWLERIRVPDVPLPAIVVVIPTMLRKRDELTSLFSTIGSVAHNGYPSSLYIVVSIDGTAAFPALVEELHAWQAKQRWPEHVFLHVTGTPERHGKPMAIEHGIGQLRELVASGVCAEFPPVYVSTDADADLGEQALSRLVARLVKRSPITGWPARAVAGNLYLRRQQMEGSLRDLFTVKGQLLLQIARHYMVANLARYNLRIVPMCGVPGVLYATWTEIFEAAPRYLSYLTTLRAKHLVRWWFGRRAPSFAASKAPPVPELLAGDTDDTVMAFMAVIARYEGGKFSFEPPRTPVHALWDALRGMFFDRALRYEPEARVYTSSPSTIKGLFKQRRRWNTARIEVIGRFWRGLFYHWTLGVPCSIVLVLILRSWLGGALLYLALPRAIAGNAPAFTLFVLGYLCHMTVALALTVPALLIDWQPRSLRLLLAVPLAPLYALAFAYVPAVVGGVNDVLLMGNVTGFAPEHTLIRGGSARIAILFRLRRAFMLAVRSVLVGDVPLGLYWFGWRETPWTPSGYEGWTTRRKPRRIVPPRSRWRPWRRERIRAREVE